MPDWLNWIEHQTSNLGVAGSSPASGDYLNLIIKLTFIIKKNVLKFLPYYSITLTQWNYITTLRMSLIV